MQSAVLDRPAPETVPETPPLPVRDDNCPQGGDHDWQGRGDHWECSKCGAKATLDS